MNIAIVTSGCMPVPAVLGGAVESLDDYLIAENEIKKLATFTVFSVYNKRANEISRRHVQTKYIFIKTPSLLKLGDKLIYRTAKNILHKKKSSSYRYILQRLWYIDRVSRYLQKNNYDKVMLENSSTLYIALKKRKNAQKYAGRYYYHLHNEVYSDFGCRDIMKRTQEVLSVSNFINHSLSAFLGGLLPEQTTVLRNCVDTKRFGNERVKKLAPLLRAKYGIQNDELLILFCGRMTEEKGIRELLKAFVQLNLPKTKLMIAGSYFFGSGMINDFERELHKIAEPAQDKIIFTGFIPYERMPEIYAMADISCIPSVWNDPAPMTVIESMASGLPVITTESGGIPEYVDSECAIVLPRDENLINNLASALTKLLDDKSLRNRLSNSALERVSKLNTSSFYDHFIYLLGSNAKNPKFDRGCYDESINLSNYSGI